jgi:hypothetical protein
MLIASGETLTGTIGAAGEVDDYTFTANAGESVVAGVMETVAGSSLSPRIQLISPTAVVLFTVTGTIGNGSTAFNLTTSGTYTLRITDASSAQTGGYAVSLAKLAGAQLNSGDGGAVTSGEYRSGTIDVADIDIYTINATTNGSLLSIAGELTGQALDLQMAVFTPSGANIYNAVNGSVVGTTETLLPATGTYYVVVWDASFNATGTYNLTLASMPGTQVVDADSVALTSGVRRTGTVAAVDADVYTITTPLNGDLLVTLAEINAPAAAFAPTLQVYSPTGALLFNQAGAIGREYFLPATAAGTYTIVVFDQSLDATGDYALTAITAPSVQPTDADSGPIASGAYRAGTLDAGDADVYTIPGTAAGSLVAVVAETAASAPIDVTMRVYSPSGAVLFNSSGAVGTGTTLTNLPATGTYTIVINDSGADATGAYALTAASVPASAPIIDGDSVTLSSGVRRTGTLDMGDMDVYTISVPLNGNLFVALSEAPTVGASFNAHLMVISPNGSVLFTQAGATGRDYFLPNAPSGTYTIIALEQFQDAAGDYALTAVAGLATQPTDADSGPLTSGNYYTGTFDTGDIDVYTISASLGGSLLVNFAETSAALTPAMVVTAPNGAVLYANGGTVSLAQLFTSLPAAGTYTIAINDSGADATGGYGLTVVALPAASQPTDVDSGPITSGAYRSGTLDMGDIDVFTINVSLGSSFVVAVAETGTQSLSSQLLVFSPSGTNIFNGAGTVGTGTTQANLTSAGTYVICVLDQFGDDTGTYNLTAVNATGPQITDADSGPLTFAQYQQGTLDPGDLDVYTLTGTQAASLLISISESEYLGPSATGEIGYQLYAPNGSQVRNTTSATGSASIDSNLAATGTYTLVIYESGIDEFMRYGFTLVSTAATPVPVGDGGTITSGQTRRGRIDYGDIDAFSFTATAGQSLLLSMSDANLSSYGPNIVVATPSGTVLTNTNTADGFNFRSDALAAGGTYTIYVLDAFGDDSGEYALSIGLSNSAQPTTGDSGPLTATPRAGEIGIGDIDIFTVAATAGVNFSITLNETPSAQAFAPRVLIYRPDGSFFSDTIITNSQTINVTSVVAGSYTVMVTENGANAMGNYSIALGTTNAVTTDTVAPRIVEGEYRFDRPTPELVVYASENIAASLQISDFVLTNTTTSTVIPGASLSISYDANTNKISIGTPGVSGGILPDGNYTLRLTALDITDASGNLLDGNGNGTGGDDYTLSFFVLAGDANRDRTVSFDDLLILAQNYGRIGMSFSQGNFNYDTSGSVGFEDLLLLAQSYGQTVMRQATPSGTTSKRDRAHTVLDLI